MERLILFAGGLNPVLPLSLLSVRFCVFVNVNDFRLSTELGEGEGEGEGVVVGLEVSVECGACSTLASVLLYLLSSATDKLHIVGASECVCTESLDGWAEGT